MACYDGVAGGDVTHGGSSTSLTNDSSTGPFMPGVPTTSGSSEAWPTTSGGSGGSGTTTSGEGETSGTSIVHDTEPGLSSSTGSPDRPTPRCGDGHKDRDEECDLGDLKNDDHGACTIECKSAECGDGLLRYDKEACDNGGNNNDDEYGGCTTDCTWGPRCGDGMVNGNAMEECDLGEGNGRGEFMPVSVPCNDVCRFEARLVFLSSVSYKGGKLGGVEGADLKCQNLAESAGFDNYPSFKAWISDASHSPKADFIQGGMDLPYVQPNGIRVADDWNDLTTEGPLPGITVTEKKVSAPGAYVWTGTTWTGAVFDANNHCNSWSVYEPREAARFGISGVNPNDKQIYEDWVKNRQWTTCDNFPCDQDARLYCFEQ